MEDILGDFNEYDDAPLTSRILALETTVGTLSNYDDTTIISRLNTVEASLGELSNYDDEPITTRVSNLETDMVNLEENLSSIQDINELIQSVSSISATEIFTITNNVTTGMPTAVTSLASNTIVIVPNEYNGQPLLLN